MKPNLISYLKPKNLLKPRHLAQGELAESVAATFLQQKGLILLDKNYRTKHGEIDLIMRDDETLVFVEVRLRQNASYGGAAMSITQSKQNKLTRTAEQYLQTHGESRCRFDAILMQSADINKVEWIKNAF